MIKGNHMSTKDIRKKPLFHPTFGSRPAQIVGRDDVMEKFINGMAEPIGSRERCLFMIGQRGMGKTALLLEMADQAKNLNMIPALVTAYDGMNDDIIETLQRNSTKQLPDAKSIQGFEVGAFGFSFGLDFSKAENERVGFRTKLAMLCDTFEKFGKGVLLLIDEANNSEEMRQLAVTYQHLVGEEKNIAIIMAGLPQAVSSVLNDKVLTFLNRADKINLGPISISEIRSYYTIAFEESGVKISDDLTDQAAEATKGYPYLMQLIGYYILKYTSTEKKVDERILALALKAAFKDMDRNVFAPMLQPLSDGDLAFIRAMSEDDGPSKTGDIVGRLQKSNSYIQPYRARLIDAGIIESYRKGEVQFTIPRLTQYLREIRDHLG